MPNSARQLSPSAPAASLAQRYAEVRARSLALVAPLSAEDACVQAMPDTSPAKWHLAHVTWFFETFLLEAREANFKAFHPAFRELFNSYYNAVGRQFPRPQRGLLTRPSLAQVLAYRADVDARMARIIADADATTVALIELGLNHEQQHQELLLMDIKYLLSLNPLAPAYRETAPPPSAPAEPLRWHAQTGAIVRVGHDGAGFHFDNETPRHDALLAPHALASRLVSNGEYLAFMRDGGYQRATLWLADGWASCQREAWQAPQYWREVDGAWFEFTLCGLHPLDVDAPVCHVSHYEADAYAQWADARLPTEFEWEAAAAATPPLASDDDEGQHLHPRATRSGAAFDDLFGAVWQWTRSAYLPYPAFKAPAGAVGEYNGKFMSNQVVLKGSCCATPAGHARASYRNFFYAHQRWPFTGIRLARDA
ncbi:MAG: ergothioneine biosynthesis protein EgtB [Proteobacteria bacterium]|nr:ergothioneine biosynthesis protein EgtB [Pseudomonadota bacterium]